MQKRKALKKPQSNAMRGEAENSKGGTPFGRCGGGVRRGGVETPPPLRLLPTFPRTEKWVPARQERKRISFTILLSEN